ncbi:MAG: Crp/Fnr family transcriptional regulator [Hyphomonadaceae bacterium]
MAQAHAQRFSAPTLAPEGMTALARRLAGGGAIFSDAERALVAQRTHAYVRAKAALVRPDELDLPLQIVQQGWAVRVANLSHERRQIIGFLLPGDIVDLDSFVLDGAPVTFAVRALTPVEVCRFEAPAFREFLESDPARLHAFTLYASEQRARICWRLADIGQRKAAGRLARLLLEFYDHLLSAGLVTDGAFECAASQYDLADAIGTTPVHVNRVLREFKQDGLIQLTRSAVHIKDRDALEALADEQ